MRAEDILEVMLQQPFEPIRVCVSDGKTYDIKHPDMVRVGRSKLLVFAPVPEHPAIFEKYDTVSLLHVTRLEPIGLRPAVSS